MSLRRIVTPFLRTFNSTPNGAKWMSFKSSLSLDKLYPDSVSTKPFEPPTSENGKFTGYIPIKDLNISYMKSSGPGGQNVHKNETKVDIRFHVETASWLREDTKQKLIQKYYTRMNKDGYFIVRSEKTRSRILNVAEALNHIREIIFKLEEPPPEVSPETLEKHRKNKEKAARIRLMEKKKHSIDKANKKVSVGDFFQ